MYRGRALPANVVTWIQKSKTEAPTTRGGLYSRITNHKWNHLLLMFCILHRFTAQLSSANLSHFYIEQGGSHLFPLLCVNPHCWRVTTHTHLHENQYAVLDTTMMHYIFQQASIYFGGTAQRFVLFLFLCNNAVSLHLHAIQCNKLLTVTIFSSPAWRHHRSWAHSWTPRKNVLPFDCSTGTCKESLRLSCS